MLASKLRPYLLMLLILPAVVRPQGEITGRSWAHWSPNEKVTYLMGFYNGLRRDYALFRDSERTYSMRRESQINPLIIERYKTDRKEYYSNNLKYNFKQIAILIDVFYTADDNKQIPVPEALRIVCLRQDDQVERARLLLLDARKKAVEKEHRDQSE